MKGMLQGDGRMMTMNTRLVIAMSQMRVTREEQEPGIKRNQIESRGHSVAQSYYQKLTAIVTRVSVITLRQHSFRYNARYQDRDSHQCGEDGKDHNGVVEDHDTYTATPCSEFFYPNGFSCLNRDPGLTIHRRYHEPTNTWSTTN